MNRNLIEAFDARAEFAQRVFDHEVQAFKDHVVSAVAGAADLRRPSENFELCAFGLSQVRREWEKVETEPPKQVHPQLIS